MATSVNTLYSKLVDALSGKPDKVPPDWRTSEQLQAEFSKQAGKKVSYQKTVRLIRAGLDAGVLERKKWGLWTGGRVFPTWHYREKK